MSELHEKSATELAVGIAERKISPVEVMQALLARIERLDPTLNAFIRLDGDAALDAARQAEREAPRGTLHGVPVGIKDIIDVAGLPTTCHSRIRLDHVAKQDAAVVTRLREAGAIMLGKLSTHEFAIGGPSFDLPFPPARNPWNRDHHPGGSSSGSGAGLAAKLFPLALGTDTGGSVRNPASACGIVGLKPTYGNVSRRGVFPLSFTLDHVGPMARTVADAALLLDAMAGLDPADPGSVAAPGGRSTADLGRGVAGLRVGFVRHFHETDLQGDPEVVAALERAAAILAGQGAIVRTVALPSLSRFAAVQRLILTSEAFAIHGEWLRIRAGDYSQSSRRRLIAGAFVSGPEYVDAQRRRTGMIAETEAVFRDVDVLLCASAMDPPCRIDDAEALARTYPRQARAPFNLTGHPAVAMMSGLSTGGLPLSVQFVGRYFDEATLLRVAASYELAGNSQFPVMAS